MFILIFGKEWCKVNAIKLRQTYGETNTPQVNFYYNLQRPARYGSPRRSDFYAARYGIVVQGAPCTPELKNPIFLDKLDF